MVFPGKLCVLAVLSLLATTVANATEQPDLDGFKLGGSFEAAQQHALEKEWKLVPLSDNLPGQWVVEETSLSLFVCNGVVASVSEQLEGDLEAFTALVFSLQLEFGKPDVQIVSIPSSVGHISTIDARFVSDAGGATVQLQSINGKRSFSVNHWIKGKCS